MSVRVLVDGTGRGCGRACLFGFLLKRALERLEVFVNRQLHEHLVDRAKVCVSVVAKDAPEGKARERGALDRCVDVRVGGAGFRDDRHELTEGTHGEPFGGMSTGARVSYSGS